mmetsp:Transcript_27137/g.50009  ORF Transcript_27137/g.50009 Transcript_27137/m.50009 type:complete len:103 (+) Transcript_27137:763-1071(+)
MQQQNNGNGIVLQQNNGIVLDYSHPAGISSSIVKAISIERYCAARTSGGTFAGIFNGLPGLPPFKLSNNASPKHAIERKNTNRANENGIEKIFSVKSRECVD